MDWGIIIAIVTSAIGATWVIASALGDVGRKFEVYVAEHKGEHKALDARIIKLSAARSKKGR